MDRLEYIKSKPGFCKILTMVVGLVATCFTLVAYTKGTYYHSYDCSSAPRRDVNNQPLTEEECYQLLRYTQKSCQIEATKDSESIEYMKENGITPIPPSPKPCPNRWLAVPFMIMLVTVYGVSLPIFLLMLLLGPNKIDYYCHLVAGVLFLVSTLFIFAFLLMVYLGDYPCTNDYDGTTRQDGSRSYIDLASLVRPQVPRLPPPPDIDDVKSCSAYRTWVYQHTSLTIGMLFAGFTGVTNIWTVLALKRFSKTRLIVLMGERQTKVHPQQVSAPTVTNNRQAYNVTVNNEDHTPDDDYDGVNAYV